MMTFSLLTVWIERFLVLFYSALIVIKISQFLMAAALNFHAYRNPKTKASSKGRLNYKPSFQVTLTIVNWLVASSGKGGDKPVQKVARSDYRVITDALLKNYHETITKPGKPRAFKSLSQARKQLFQDFSMRHDEFTWQLISTLAWHGKFMLAEPLGLQWLYNTSIWFGCLVIGVFRDCVVLGHSANAFIIYLAIASTITDVYIICIKDGLSWEEGLRKYQWLDLFDKPQSHPLVGTNVCPMYKREVTFSSGDVMDFELEPVEELQNAMAHLVETPNYKRWWSSGPRNTFVAIGNFLAVGVLLFSQYSKGVTVDASFPFWGLVSSFYVARTLVDRFVGTQWTFWWTL